MWEDEVSCKDQISTSELSEFSFPTCALTTSKYTLEILHISWNRDIFLLREFKTYHSSTMKSL